MTLELRVLDLLDLADIHLLADVRHRWISFRWMPGVASHPTRRAGQLKSSRISGVVCNRMSADVQASGRGRAAVAALGGLLLAVSRVQVVFAANAATFLWSAALVVALRGQEEPHERGDAPEAAAAERAVRNLSGIRGVSNLIQVKPHASVPDVKQRIEGALKRHAELDSKQILVEAMDGKVILRGKVRSWTERRDAETAAWAAPGVTNVEDELLVQV
jgi:hypothetical protein